MNQKLQRENRVKSRPQSFFYCVCPMCGEAYEAERFNVWHAKPLTGWDHICKKKNSYPMNDFGVVFVS